MKQYEITIEYNGLNDTIDVEASSIIAALEKVHKDAQLHRFIDSKAYRIVDACQVYSASGQPLADDWIRSKYPIPGGPNPDMWEITGREKKVV